MLSIKIAFAFEKICFANVFFMFVYVPLMFFLRLLAYASPMLILYSSYAFLSYALLMVILCLSHALPVLLPCLWK